MEGLSRQQGNDFRTSENRSFYLTEDTYRDDGTTVPDNVLSAVRSLFYTGPGSTGQGVDHPNTKNGTHNFANGADKYLVSQQSWAFNDKGVSIVWPATVANGTKLSATVNFPLVGEVKGANGTPRAVGCDVTVSGTAQKNVDSTHWAYNDGKPCVQFNNLMTCGGYVTNMQNVTLSFKFYYTNTSGARLGAVENLSTAVLTYGSMNGGSAEGFLVDNDIASNIYLGSEHVAARQVSGNKTDVYPRDNDFADVHHADVYIAPTMVADDSPIASLGRTALNNARNVASHFYDNSATVRYTNVTDTLSMGIRSSDTTARPGTQYAVSGWFIINTKSLGPVDPKTPVKSASPAHNTEVGAGQKITYTVTQQISAWSDSDFPYTSMVFSDEIDPALTYGNDLKVFDTNGKDVTATAGSTAFSGGVLKYTFKAAWLADNLDYNGKNLRFVFSGTVKSSLPAATASTTVKNKASVNTMGSVKWTNEVQHRLPVGHVTIVKTDADNAAPSSAMAGAVFGVYSDSACTNLLARVTIGANGRGSTEDVLPLLANPYYVREIEAPAGYKLDSTVHRVDAVK